MSGFFSSQKEGKTILIVDIENGSVASALVHIAPGSKPKLFGATRALLPMRQQTSGSELSRHMLAALLNSLLSTAQVAYEMRQNPALIVAGHITQVEVMFAPPWVSSKVSADGLRFAFEPELMDSVYALIGTVARDAPVHMHPKAVVLAHVQQKLLSGRELISHMTAEILELIMVEDGKILTHATIPIGFHTLLRDIQLQSTVSAHEAKSALQLLYMSPTAMHPIHIPLQKAGEKIVQELYEAAKPMVEMHPTQSIVVIVPEEAQDWFIYNILSHEKIASLFPETAITRAINSSNILPFVDAHADIPDMPLLLDTLFINAQHQSAYSVV